jgi:glycine/D-amino acid oxidase-like deaminating enzyme
LCYEEQVITADAVSIPAVQLPASADAVVIGAGMVGAATAAWLTATGRRVCVIDRAGPLGGTSASGEGNILVSDKLPGPELSLALRSTQLWLELADQAAGAIEFERKGGVVVATSQPQLDALARLSDGQRAAGVEATALDPAGLREAEPHLAPGLPGGAFYPQDCQVQPMRAAMAYLARAAATGLLTVTRAEVTGLLPRHGAAHLVTDRGQVATPVVVNAAGPWGGEVARRLGSFLPVRPRRGHILVTEPLPVLVRHKVYESDYVGAVASDGGLACSAVVEATASGTVLIGSSRDFGGLPSGGFPAHEALPGGRGRPAPPDQAVLAEMARRAIALFPFLRGVRAIRAYAGYRPACADHLPVIGPDTLVAGLYHATGHEGAGIGLAPATAELLTALIEHAPPPVDPAPFSPGRFSAGHTEAQQTTGGHDDR